MDAIPISFSYGRFQLEERTVVEDGRLYFESRRIEITERDVKFGEWERTGVSIALDA